MRAEQELVIPSVQNIYDAYLVARNDYNSRHRTESEALWWASSIGSCLRSQWLRANKIPPVRDMDVLSLRRFSVGDSTADALRTAWWHLGILIAPETPHGEEFRMFDPELRLSGRIDAIIGGKVQDPPEGEQQKFFSYIRDALIGVFGPTLPTIGVELKTTNSKSWWWAAKQNRPVAGEHQLLQIAAYQVMAERLGEPKVDRWVIANVSKDDNLIDESAPTKVHRETVLKRINTLNNAFDAASPPACSCMEDFGGKGWRYCSWYSGSDESMKGKNPVPDGECCGVGL